MTGRAAEMELTTTGMRSTTMQHLSGRTIGDFGDLDAAALLQDCAE
jgi:hypothetical protein